MHEPISDILKKYVTEEQAKSLVSDLEKNVDDVEIKNWLKKAFPPEKKQKRLSFYLKTIVAFHMAIIFFNLIAIFVLPFAAPWYIALPIDTLLVNLLGSSTPCPLTKLESTIRRRMGLPEIRLFVAHYIVKPLRKKFKKKN